MSCVVFEDATLFDGINPEAADPMFVLVEGQEIKEVSERPITVGKAERIDCGGKVLMPGMIDAHVHVYASSCSLTKVTRQPLSYNALFAARSLRHALTCGFTAVRDVGGADVGLAQAIRQGFIVSPRLYYGGRIISQTGGHGDFRPSEEIAASMLCGCCSHQDDLAVLADGVPEVRRAVRSELRRGASHIKIMASGGVASPSDPLERCQFSEEEIVAAVDEATRAGFYVAAHCHPAEAVRRSVSLGVRSIEHGTLIDEETATAVAAAGAFIVPTMAVIFALRQDGAQFGLSAANLAKLELIADRALTGLQVMSRAGVKMGFGTDLLGPHYDRQCTEFTLRSRMLTPFDILHSATAINAEILQMEGRLGVIKPGALADLLVVDGNPLKDINLLAANGRHLTHIMIDGSFVKRPTP